MHYFNEKGNTLVLILALISVFSILYISIVGVSITNSKQITITEDNAQAVSIAEMGITYYKTALYNKSTEVKANSAFKDGINQTITKEINDTFGKITASNKESTEAEINKTTYFNKLSAIASNQYMEIIKRELETIDHSFFQSVTVAVDTASSSSFTISNIKQTSNKDGITYTFDSKGINGDKEITLSSVLTMPVKLDPITLEAETNSETGNSNDGGNIDDGSSENQWIAKTGLTGNDVPDPGRLAACVSPIPDNYRFTSNCQYNGSTTITKNTDIVNAILKTNGALTISSNVNQFSNSTIYTTNDLTVSGNLNGVSSIKIHAGGSGSFSNLNSTISNSIIEIAGSGSFQNIKTSDSTIYVGGAATFQNGNSLAKTKLEVKGSLISGNWNDAYDSIISIGGAAVVGNINSLFQNTTLSIQGSGSFQNVNSLKNSTIYVGGAATFGEINEFNNSQIKINGDFYAQGLNNPTNNGHMIILGNGEFSKINNLANISIYIGGNGKIGSNLNIGDNGKVCVKGTLDLTGNIHKNGNGKIYASRLTPNTAQINGSKIDTNANNFATNCNSDFPDGDENDGGSNTPETVYLPAIVNDLRVEDSKINVDYDY
ncbi:hypothetical protein [Niallia sp.]|uniref:hypothetical protein n=1 Tax=Niallia sp. TaxID=2837523 RepID=UPI00289BE483|nr:hypothetical protein [Niallia sp.]